jgi:hypothetical protein
MSLFGKILTTIAKHVLLPAVIKIATNPKAPLSLDTAKDALVKAAEAEAMRQAGKRLGV